MLKGLSVLFFLKELGLFDAFTIYMGENRATQIKLK